MPACVFSAGPAVRGFGWFLRRSGLNVCLAASVGCEVLGEIRIKILEHLIAFSRIGLRTRIGFGRAKLRDD